MKFNITGKWILCCVKNFFNCEKFEITFVRWKKYFIKCGSIEKCNNTYFPQSCIYKLVFHIDMSEG